MAWPIFADHALSHQNPSVRHHRTSRNRPEPATAAATKSRAISRHPVASASSSSQIGQAAPGAAGFCYLVTDGAKLSHQTIGSPMSMMGGSSTRPAQHVSR